MFEIDGNDPRGELIERSGVTPEHIAEISELMSALGALREAEERISEASMRYMQLGPTDMKTIHFLIVSANQRRTVTPGALATHLGITTPSTTKLLDRLERGGHIVRSPHPGDRRASIITVTEGTRDAATRTIGAQHAKRFASAARLNSAERAVVTEFLLGMAHDLSLDGVAWAQDEPPSDSRA